MQSGLPFQVFPQALTLNGFTGVVMGATLGPALIGEFLSHIMHKNATLLSAGITDVSAKTAFMQMEHLYGTVQMQALIVPMKEIYGWLLIIAIISLMCILISHNMLRPFAIFPKWSSIRHILKHMVRAVLSTLINLNSYS